MTFWAGISTSAGSWGCTANLSGKEGDMESPLWLLGAVLGGVGVAGTVIPALPGSPLVFLGLVCAAWADGFQKVGGFTISILALLMVLTFVVDFLASRWGAKRVGASWLALLGAFLGMIVGLFFSIPG